MLELNGSAIPDQLPPEMKPPSSRDLDGSVELLKGFLRDENSRSSSRAGQASLGKVRSFNDTAPARQDATVYKYKEDDDDSGSYYQSKARHVDRRNVRTGNETPHEDLSILKRQLEDTQKRLDKATTDSASRSAEDEALDREMDDLRYRVKRVQEDLEYVARGPRTSAKDQEKLRLERDLLGLLHERIPEVERKIEERERRRDQEKREWARERDRRNETFGRRDYNKGTERDHDNDRDRERDERYDRNRYDDRDRGYSRDTYDRDRDRERVRDSDRDRDRYNKSRADDRDRFRDRERGSDNDKPHSPPRAARSPPPPAPAAAARSPPPAPPAPSTTLNVPPAAPVPTSSPAPTLKNMTPEERSAYIREQSQRKLQERMLALGVISSSASPDHGPSLDAGIEERLLKRRKEAEEKAKQAELELAQREQTRRERREKESGIKNPPVSTPTTTSPPSRPGQAPRGPPPAPAAPRATPSVPAAPKRAPAPPPPRKTAAHRHPVSAPTPPAPAPPPPAPLAVAPAPTVPEEDPEEKRIREREEQIRKQREARAARLRQLEQEEEEARRAEEEYEARRRAFISRPKSTAPPEPPAVKSLPAVVPPVPSLPPTVRVAPPSPQPRAVPQLAPAPPAPPVVSEPAAAISPSPVAPSNNPFNRLIGQGSTPAGSTPVANGSSNPFFRSQAPASPTVPPPAQSSTPAPTSYHTAPSHSEDEWDDATEKDADDSSDDELTSSRDTRKQLAQQLFGSIIPARPQSTGIPSQSATPAPPPPPPPTAPAPPAAPPAPFAVVGAPPQATGGGDRSALLDAIQSGARLRKAVTNDRSAAAVTGQVIGDPSPPVHVNAAPRNASPPPSLTAFPPIEDLDISTGFTRDNTHRQSVDWYAGLAADQGAVYHMPPMAEEDEEPKTAVPDIHVHDISAAVPDPMDDVDKSIGTIFVTNLPRTAH